MISSVAIRVDESANELNAMSDQLRELVADYNV
jgi:hypothetical protein